MEHLSQREGFQEVEFEESSHTYRLRGKVYPHVTGVIASAGRCSWEFVDEDIRLHSIHRGNSVHWLTQLEDEGALNYRTVPKGLRGFRRAWNDWKHSSGFHIMWIEKRFVSVYGFAGTIDRAGTLPTIRNGFTTPAVVDIKSAEGDGSVANWVRYQLCAYSLAVDPRPAVARTVRRIAVRLSRDGSYRVREFPLCEWDRDFAIFIEDLKQCQKNSSQ